MMDGICGSRPGAVAFHPPNIEENVTYRFNCAKQGEIKFWNGVSCPVSILGFPIESQSKGSVPKWKTLWEYSPDAARTKIILSGRFLVQCPDEIPMQRRELQSACVFKFCTRGRPIFESVKTKTFTHTAHLVTSGVFFSLNIETSQDGACLNPRVMLVLECGDEVTLVEDRLGPLCLPESFYVDFAVLDDAGRNVQLDLIFRGVPDRGGNSSSHSRPRSFRTLRTCLQEYTTFNSQVSPAHIALGSSDMQAHFTSSTVHLQDLVLSEEPVQDVCPEIATQAAAGSPSSEGAVGRPVFPGAATLPALSTSPQDASPNASDLACHQRALDAKHAGQPPASGLPPLAAAALATVAAAGVPGHTLFKGLSLLAEAVEQANSSTFKPRQLQGVVNKTAAATASEDFWFHVRYTIDSDLDRGHRREDHQSSHRGEFWLTREIVAKSHVYFRCSTTLQQALAMCIIFRFSCPNDYLSLIENQAAGVLRDLHIPTNGVVMGVEPDPRHKGGKLIRMFLEHRNDILDDIVVCECKAADLARVVCCQEVYDSGSHIYYRIVLFFPDGSRQQASLQVDSGRIEESNQDANSHYQVVEDPSSRFPILPCLSRQLLSPSNRIFVYTSTAHEREEESFHDGTDSDPFATPTIGCRSVGDANWSCHSDGGATGEDWQSAGGGQSDGEPDGAISLKAAQQTASIKALEDQDIPEFRRPLVDSILLMSKVEDPPFSHGKQPLVVN